MKVDVPGVGKLVRREHVPAAHATLGVDGAPIHAERVTRERRIGREILHVAVVDDVERLLIALLAEHRVGRAVCPAFPEQAELFLILAVVKMEVRIRAVHGRKIEDPE